MFGRSMMKNCYKTPHQLYKMRHLYIFTILAFFFGQNAESSCEKKINSFSFDFQALKKSPSLEILEELKIEYLKTKIQSDKDKRPINVNTYSKSTLLKLSNLELLTLSFQAQNYISGKDLILDELFLKHISFEQELLRRHFTEEEVCYLSKIEFLKKISGESLEFYNKQSLVIDEAMGLYPMNDYYYDLKLLGKEASSNTWLGTLPNNLNTSYSTFFEIIRNEVPKKGETFVDMGSAQGRLGMIIGSLFPGINYYGVELYPHRIKNSIKTIKLLGFNNVHFITADFTLDNFNPPIGDYYYFYIPNKNSEHNFIAIEKLKKIAQKKKIKIITLFMDEPPVILKRFPWLKYLGRKKIYYSIYQYYDVYQSIL